MKFFKYLYWAENIQDKERDKIRFYLKVHKKTLHVFVIALCEGEDQLEIYDSLILLQGFYRRNPPFVIGIAKTYYDALMLVQKITQETYDHTGTADIKAYLQKL